MATFADKSVAQAEAIKEWALAQLNTRMEMIGRAATFVDTIDKKQALVIGKLELESGVNEINVLKATIEAVAKETSAKFDQVIIDFKKFADDARVEISRPWPRRRRSAPR